MPAWVTPPLFVEGREMDRSRPVPSGSQEKVEEALVELDDTFILGREAGASGRCS